MKNLRRLALVCGIAALSAVAFSPKAQAQTANVDFTGQVPATCTINSVTPGVLNYGGTTALGADNSQGTRGLINVTCNAGTTFAIANIANNGTPAAIHNLVDGANAEVNDSFNGTTPARGSIAFTSNYTATLPLSTPGALQTGPITNKDYGVHLSVFRASGNLPVGNYQYRVSVVLAPQ